MAKDGSNPWALKKRNVNPRRHVTDPRDSTPSNQKLSLFLYIHTHSSVPSLVLSNSVFFSHHKKPTLSFPSSPTNGSPKGREEARGEKARREGSGGEEAQGREEDIEGRRKREEEEENKEERGDLQDLHLQGAEAGSPRHRNLKQGHGDHEQFHKRHLREARPGVVAIG